MKSEKNYLRNVAIFSIILAIIIFSISITYAFISNLGLIWIIFLVAIAFIEVFVIYFSILFLINPIKGIFFIGLISLFAGLVPGIMILSFYFKKKKVILDNLVKFEN